MDALEQYIHDHTSPEEELLHELDRATNLRVVQPRMLSGHIQGRLLEMLVRMLRPRRILEIGTFTGYSALSMAAGLGEGATLDTILFRPQPARREDPAAHRFGTRHRPGAGHGIRPGIHRRG